MQAAPFDVAAEMAALTANDAKAGAVGCFVGRVRGEAGERLLSALRIEDYRPMTEAALRDLLAEAARRWTLLGARVVHRVGALAPSEPIVLVLTASAHRAAALDSVAFLADWLKTRAPLWKREVFADGTEAWVAPRAEDEAAAARWG